MPDNGSQVELTICRMQDGGYLVRGDWMHGQAAEMFFASTTIDESLNYIRAQIVPVNGIKGYDNQD